jgi:signal transduction histidine kinase
LRHLVGSIQQANLPAACQADSIDTTDELQYIADAFRLLSAHLERYLDERTETKAELRRQSAQLQHLLEQISQAREEERRRLALDIHDGVAQFLVIALQQARSAERRLAQDPKAALHKLQLAQQLLAESMVEIDRVVFDLRPPTLGDMELVHALEGLAFNLERLGKTSYSVKVQGQPWKLPDEWEMAAYRIAQEALHNVNKHAEATRAQVLVEFGSQHFRMTVADDGIGFAVDGAFSERHRCMGIIGMKERAESAGGTLQVESGSSSGTRVALELAMCQMPRPAICTQVDFAGREVAWIGSES